MTLRLFFNLLLTEVEHKNEISHSVFAWLRLTIKIPKQCVKLFQIKKNTWKKSLMSFWWCYFVTLLWCFHCWIWTNKYPSCLPLPIETSRSHLEFRYKILHNNYFSWVTISYLQELVPKSVSNFFAMLLFETTLVLLAYF